MRDRAVFSAPWCRRQSVPGCDCASRPLPRVTNHSGSDRIIVPWRERRHFPGRRSWRKPAVSKESASIGRFAYARSSDDANSPMHVFSPDSIGSCEFPVVSQVGRNLACEPASCLPAVLLPKIARPRTDTQLNTCGVITNQRGPNQLHRLDPCAKMDASSYPRWPC